MIPYKTFQHIDLGIFDLHVWGIFAALAFLAAIFTASREAKRKGLNPEAIYDSAPWIIIGSIIGARIVFLIENPAALTSPIDIISVWKGGLAFHGGFFGGIAAFIAYAKRNKLAMWKYADAIAPSIAIGHAIGRIGCYLTGLHIGRETTAPWGVLYEGSIRHPTPAYEFIGLIGLFLLLTLAKHNRIVKARDGLLFMLYVALYSLLRFFIEFFRVDPKYMGLTAAQYIVIALFIISCAGIAVLINKTRRAQKA
ncbi:prolipoprotein diacylglyceryl transferase [Candidatus Woesearchaeota archaeon]|nr:prolipoprotein diacylglyceryl transferase [Candidatus Woesearchaeota archaeon]